MIMCSEPGEETGASLGLVELILPCQGFICTPQPSTCTVADTGTHKTDLVNIGENLIYTGS